MQRYKAMNGQSLLDVCLDTYGSLESLVKLALDNNLATVNDSVSNGEIFVWNPSPDVPQVLPIYATDNLIQFFVERDVEGIIDDASNFVTDELNDFII